jgi:lipopolysaccharide transport system permease protein
MTFAIPIQSGAGSFITRLESTPFAMKRLRMTLMSMPVDPHATQPVTVGAMLSSLFRNRQLIGQMTRREIVGRYRGSVMGLAWSFVNPVFMLAVYTLVFSEVFKSRWQGAADPESKTQFAIVLFVGLIILSIVSEVLNRAPGLIVSNANFVKKVVFPVEILPVVSMGTALFHAMASIAVLLLALLLFNGELAWTVILLPLVLLPLVLLILGISWMLASLGVFIRDVGQTIGIFTSVLMFVSPVFYPLSAVPERFRPFLQLNPLTFIIEQAREVVVWGHTPDWQGLALYGLVAALVAWAGFAWFQKTRKGFADVL